MVPFTATKKHGAASRVSVRDFGLLAVSTYRCRMHWKRSLHQKRQNQPPSVIDLALKDAPMAFNEDSSASGHDEPWIQWYGSLYPVRRTDVVVLSR
eukprot:scaffold2366_cov159-Amphora_coffeaeformis.AAC.22